MPTREEIYTAIRNADKAGDAESVRKLGAYLQTMGGQPAPTKVTSLPPASYDPTEGMSTFEKLAAGVGKGMTDMARGAGQVLGLVSRKDVEDARRLDAPLMKTTAGQFGNVVGNLALTAPLAAIPGANTVAGGATIGALTGLLQPSTSTGETVANTALGGVAGAAIPAAVNGIRTLRAAAEPFYAAGQNRIVGRALNAAAGSDAPAVAQRLAQAGEIVPGSAPTVGQAAENAGIAALDRAATASNPGVTNAVSERMAAQNAARVNALRDLTGDDGRRAFFAAERDATANQLYGAARKAPVNPQVYTPEAQANIAQFMQRIPKEVLDRARKLAKIGGEPMTDATSIQGLHWVKEGVDDLIGEAKRKGNDTLARQLTGLQKDLLAGIDNISPDYAAARQVYAAMSKPVNQMDVAQTIADRSINPLTGALQPQAYARALNDRTAASTLGMPGATLANTLEPEQLNALQAILHDAQRATAAQNAGRGVGSDTVQKLAYTNMLDQAGVPTFMRKAAPFQVLGNVGGRVADAAYARANRELGNQLAEVMLDPQAAARLMQQATPAEQNAILRLLRRGGQGLALTAPSAANAQH